MDGWKLDDWNNKNTSSLIKLLIVLSLYQQLQQVKLPETLDWFIVYIHLTGFNSDILLFPFGGWKQLFAVSASMLMPRRRRILQRSDVHSLNPQCANHGNTLHVVIQQSIHWSKTVKYLFLFGAVLYPCMQVFVIEHCPVLFSTLMPTYTPQYCFKTCCFQCLIIVI